MKTFLIAMAWIAAMLLFERNAGRHIDLWSYLFGVAVALTTAGGRKSDRTPRDVARPAGGAGGNAADARREAKP